MDTSALPNPPGVVPGALREDREVSSALVGARDRDGRVERLIESERTFRQIFECNPQPMLLVDRDSLACLDANRAALALYHCSRKELTGACMTGRRVDGSRAQLHQSNRGVWAGDARRLGGRHRTKSGEPVDIELEIADATFAGRAALLVVAKDVTDSVRLEQQLRYQALYDAVTGLPNRALFTDRLAHALARKSREGGSLAVVILDLGSFHRINGSFGHEAGDLALQQVAARISFEVRSSDTVARIGGGEFAILLEEVQGSTQVEEVCQRIQTSLSSGVLIDCASVPLEASIGITLSDGGDVSGDLLRNASLALYGAQTSGNARSYIYQPEMLERVSGRLQLEADLRLALERNDFRVYFQPVLQLASHRVVGVEALARWTHPVHGAIPPVEFIGLAEETGLIETLGRKVLHEACTRVRKWQTQIPGFADLSVAVNLSPRQLEATASIDEVRSALTSSGLSPADLILEVTETAVMRDVSAAARQLAELRELGVRVSLDDFGTGYSSLSQLRDLPIDILKVDRSFVTTLFKDRFGADLLAMIVHLGESLGIEVVAEGVESRDQARVLQRLGDVFVQGYLYSKPLDPSSTAKFLGARSVESASPAA